MKKKKIKSKKVSIEFDEKHLSTLVTALEVYSRLRSGQISMAMDTAFWDANLSWDERQFIENTIRFMVFPSSPKREYDGHGGFYDQYNNEYDEHGSLVEESEEWKQKKNRHHLDYPNSYYGVGCEETKDGTVAWEIKKTIEQYLHYQRNGGYRRICDVSGDGAMQCSDVPVPAILNWKPEKSFKIPSKYQKPINHAMNQKKFTEVWNLVDEAFKDKTLPRGNTSKVEQDADGKYCVVVQEPYELNYETN